MAVYTEVSSDELDAFIAAYDVGAALSFKGIAEGIENSNYLLRTEKGNFILTLYEKRVDAKDLPFFLGLLDHLAARKDELARLAAATGWTHGCHHTDTSAQSALLWLYRSIAEGGRA